MNSNRENLSLLWLVIFAIAMSAVSLYYYLMVLKQIYVTDSADELPTLNVPYSYRSVLVILALLVILLGCAPELLITKLQGIFL